MVLIVAMLPAVMGMHLVLLNCNCHHVQHCDVELLIGPTDIEYCTEADIHHDNNCTQCEADEHETCQHEENDECGKAVDNAAFDISYFAPSTNYDLSPTLILLPYTKNDGIDTYISTQETRRHGETLNETSPITDGWLERSALCIFRC